MALAYWFISIGLSRHVDILPVTAVVNSLKTI